MKKLEIDTITLSIIQKALENIAKEMGIVLRRASFSPNCKERLDFSCAIFNEKGELIAQAEHIPVHLGAMFSSMEIILQEYSVENLNPGDVIILNSPYLGGTHLPDITFIMPVFIDGRLSFFVNNRAHHADIGGSTPGSMPGISNELYEEGLIIPPIKLYSKGNEVKDVLRLILSNVRVKEERLGDFRAQRAALLRGEERLKELSKKYGLELLLNACEKLMDISEQAFQYQLNQISFKNKYQFEDFLDSNGITEVPVKIKTTVQMDNDKLKISFKGTASQQKGNVNTPRSVVFSCVYYVFRSLTDPTIPTNAGLFRNIEIDIPKGSILDPKPPAAVSSGNVETSQRIVDVLLGALSKVLPEIPAASQGTMNNITIGGFNNGIPFTYYETIGGGCGAGKCYQGISGIHSHMTNTLNTPIEAIELSYPLRVNQYAIRKNSGGKGIYNGGNGLIREIECLVDCIVSVVSERRVLSPYGLHGGSDGKKGVNLMVKENKKEIVLPGRVTVNFKAGESLIIKTPGGGAHGRNIGD